MKFLDKSGSLAVYFIIGGIVALMYLQNTASMIALRKIEDQNSVILLKLNQIDRDVTNANR